jgi:hypothetical protein
MGNRASGTFEVSVTPHAPEEAGNGNGNGNDLMIGRMTIDKRFEGDLTATSKVQMLSIATKVKNSAGYVAMEWVSGILNGRSGRFALQHSGSMSRGTPTLSITVVPDSGTGELDGISGRMAIEVVGGKHHYVFDYTFAEME